MEYFEIGSCFKSYSELIEKLEKYCSETYTKFTTKDCRLIKKEFVENDVAKNRFIYTDLKLICVHGRNYVSKHTNPKRKKRNEKNVQTGCPAYFRLKLIQSGIALQIVALNIRHNHALEPPKEENKTEDKRKKRRSLRSKGDKKFKDEVKCEEEDIDISDMDQDLIDCMDDDIKYPNVVFDLKGFCAPVFTPFGNDMGLNVEEIPNYASYLNNNGVTAVLVNSTVGEESQLTVEERKLIVESWHKAVQATEQHLMVQIGGCPLSDVEELVKHAEELGVNSILYKPDTTFKLKTLTELLDYVKHISEISPKTPLLYHHSPSETGVEINVKAFLEEVWAKVRTFRGIYYCSNNWDDIVHLTNDTSRKCAVFLGNEKLLAGAFAMGFDSAIVPCVNLLPEYCLDILKATEESDLTKARTAQSKLTEICLHLAKEENVIPILKTLMNTKNKVNVGPCRPPLKQLTDGETSFFETFILLKDK